jgi:hypothetical protein
VNSKICRIAFSGPSARGGRLILAGGDVRQRFDEDVVAGEPPLCHLALEEGEQRLASQLGPRASSPR